MFCVEIHSICTLKKSTLLWGKTFSFLFKMQGCATATRLSLNENVFESARAAILHFENGERVRTLLLEEEKARDVLKTFRQDAAIHQRKIMEKFAVLREQVNKGERAVMDRFDAKFKQSIKLLEAQITALEVKAQQCVIDARDSSADFQARVYSQTPRTINFAGIDILTEMLSTDDFCRFSVRESTNNVQDEPDAPLAMYNLIKRNKTETLRKIVSKYITQPMAMPFQGRLLKTENLNLGKRSPSGFSISNDGSVLAVSFCSSPSLQFFATENCSMIGCVGTSVSYGTRHGRFVSGGTNIIVAYYDKHCVEEITMTGDHVRYLSNSDSCHKILHPHPIDANLKTVVVAEFRGHRVYVLDYSSGELSAIIGMEGSRTTGQLRSIRDLRLSPCGTFVVISDQIGLCLFTLDNSFIKRVDLDEWASNTVSFLCTGQIAVQAEWRGSQNILIFDREFSQINQRLNQFGLCTQICAVNNFVFVFMSSKMYVLW